MAQAGAIRGLYAAYETTFAAEANQNLLGITNVHFEKNIGEVPSAYSLNQNYPNPFIPTTDISFVLPEDGRGVLEVFNVLGVKVASLTNSQMSAGSYFLKFDASQLPSGTYFYRIKMNQYTATRKINFLK